MRATVAVARTYSLFLLQYERRSGPILTVGKPAVPSSRGQNGLPDIPLVGRDSDGDRPAFTLLSWCLPREHAEEQRAFIQIPFTAMSQIALTGLELNSVAKD